MSLPHWYMILYFWDIVGNMNKNSTFCVFVCCSSMSGGQYSSCNITLRLYSDYICYTFLLVCRSLPVNNCFVFSHIYSYNNNLAVNRSDIVGGESSKAVKRLAIRAHTDLRRNVYFNTSINNPLTSAHTRARADARTDTLSAYRSFSIFSDVQCWPPGGRFCWHGYCHDVGVQDEVWTDWCESKCNHERL